MTQSIGHCKPNAHVRYSDPCGQATPPKAGCMSERTRFCQPPSHVLVQTLQAFQAPTTQSRGHACVLHDLVAALCGQARPPNFGATVVRVRFWKPLPHDLVQVLHFEKLPY